MDSKTKVRVFEKQLPGDEFARHKFFVELDNRVYDLEARGTLEIWRDITESPNPPGSPAHDWHAQRKWREEKEVTFEQVAQRLEKSVEEVLKDIRASTKQ